MPSPLHRLKPTASPVFHAFTTLLVYSALGCAADSSYGEELDSGADAGEPDASTAVAGLSLDFCPKVTSFDASPLQVFLGGEIQLTAWTRGRAKGISWSGEGGSFSPSQGMSTTFTCASAGAHELTATATGAPGCAAHSNAVRVRCEAP